MAVKVAKSWKYACQRSIYVKKQSKSCFVVAEDIIYET